MCVCVFESVRKPYQCVVAIFGACVCESARARARVRVCISVCVSYVQTREVQPDERVRMIVGEVQRKNGITHAYRVYMCMLVSKYIRTCVYTRMSVEVCKDLI